MFITSLGINLAYIFTLCILTLTTNVKIGRSLLENMESVPMFYISCWIMLALSGVFVLPVLFLVFIHWTNFCKNKTTNERFSKQKINNTTLTSKMNNSTARSSDQSSLLENVEFNSFMGIQKRNWFSNCLMMCDYRPPSQIELKNEILRAD